MGNSKVDGHISRRGFLQGAAIGGLGLAAAGTLAACSPASSKGDAVQSAPQGKVLVDFNGVNNPTEMTGDGRYVTKVMGHEDYLWVATEFSDGKIVDCAVVTHKETIGIGSFACARIPSAIVEHQSINVPNIRGCSVTSLAIKSAVKEAIELAGYDVDSFSEAIAEPDDRQQETKDVDVVVVGGGTSGLVCASKLVDLGYSVLVLEKHAIPGGSWAMTYSGMMPAETRRIKAYNTDGSVFPSYATMEGKLKALQEESDPEFDKYDGQAPFAKMSYPALSRAVDYLEEIGVGFMPLGFFEGTYGIGFSTVLAPGMYMGGAGFAAMTVAQRIERSANGEIRYLTKVTELVQDAQTKHITGVKAVGLKSDDTENGHELTVNAKAVVLATGSYAHNVDLLKEYEPKYADQQFHCCSASTGDGQVMALKAGSRIECTGIDFPAYPATTSFFEIAFIDSHHPCKMVNSTGGWIGQTGTGHEDMSRALMDEKNGGRFFFILDALSETTLRFYPMMGYDTYKALFDRGEVFYYPSVEAAMEDLELPELAEYLEENNRAAKAEELDKYGCECNYLETGAGIYVIPGLPVHYQTPSGICIDPSQHVITDSYVIGGENTVIPGLFACGDVPGTISTREGRNYYNGHALAVGSGFLVAETIQKEIVL